MTTADIPADSPSQPGGFSLSAAGDVHRKLTTPSGQCQPMAGFDPEYTDIVDYIIKITHHIWEEKAVGLIYDTYVPNVAVWTSDGLIYGREELMAGTIRTLAAFPDVRLYADEILWSGDDRQGFHTSHRIVWVGHNTGHSLYGPPTGRRIQRVGIANCYVKENRIVEEWIARDELALVLQLGYDPFETASRLASPATLLKTAAGELERTQGQGLPAHMPPRPAVGFDIEDFVRRAFHEIWDWRLLNKVDAYYSKAFICHTVPACKLAGPALYKAHLLGLMAAFPDVVLTIEHLYWMGDEAMGYKVMVRWLLQGTHRGPGPFGAPTGRRIAILGISHLIVRGGLIQEEWMIYDRFALLKQLAAPDGDV